MAAVSRLGPGGYSRPPYGSFAGKPVTLSTVDAGSSISGGYWSKGQWHKLKKEVAEEREREAIVARQEAEAERKEAALSPLQRAERDLAQCEAECHALTQAFSELPARHVFDRLNIALERFQSLTGHVATLRRDEAEAKAKSEAAKAKALRELERQEAADALAVRQLQSKISHALAAHASTARLTQQLAHLHLQEAAFRVRQQMALASRPPPPPPPTPEQIRAHRLERAKAAVRNAAARRGMH